jgi:signal transduction histidine kinase/DNA-binding response OmpR family regulator
MQGGNGRAYQTAHGDKTPVSDLIETLEEGFAVFDSEDRLSLCNARFRSFFSDGLPIAPGRTRAEIMEDALQAGLFMIPPETPPQRFMLKLLDEAGSELRLSDGSWLRLSHRSTPEGGQALLAVDITAVKRHDSILSAVSGAAEQFLAGKSWQETVPRVLDQLSMSAAVDRSYIYRCQPLADGDILAKRLVGWRTPHLRPDQILPPAPESFPFDKFHLTRWKDELSAGREIVCRISELPENERKPFRGIDIDALCMLPIFDAEGWWGFMGFHRSKRSGGPWHREEAEALSIGARILTAAIRRESQENSLRAARDRADGASRAKSDFLALMSHEIRTPLNGILGMLDLLRAEELPGDCHTYAQTARDSADHLLDIITDILDLSDIQGGTLDLNEQYFDPAALAGEALAQYAARAAAKGLSAAVSVDYAVPPELVGDAGRLRQILVKLVGNAVKFTDRGGVALTLTVARPEEVEGTGAPPGGDAENRVILRCDVTDSGIGVPPEEQARLFEIFSTGGEVRRRKQGGTGVGLKIAGDLARMMGGRVRLVDTGLSGSWFRLEISFKARAAAPGPETRPLIGRRLALADPCAVTRAARKFQLESWGAELATGAETGGKLLDGAEALLIDETLLGDTPPPSGIPVLVLSRDTMTRRGELPSLRAPARPQDLFHAITHLLAGEPDHVGTEDNARPPRVLVADDSPTNRMVALTLLGRHGIEAEAVGDGRAVLEILRRAEFDLILMDIAMPEMDGIEAARSIRHLSGPVSRIPILALTANFHADDRARCAEAGMNDILAKPIQPDMLFSKLERLLGRSLPAAPPHPAAAAPLPADPAAGDGLTGLIDRAALDALAQEFEADILGRLVAGYLADIAGALPRIEEALEAKDSVALSRLCHSLKSSSATFGAAALAARADEVERLAGNLTQPPLDIPKALMAAAGIPGLIRRSSEALKPLAAIT